MCLVNINDWCRMHVMWVWTTFSLSLWWMLFMTALLILYYASVIKTILCFLLLRPTYLSTFKMLFFYFRPTFLSHRNQSIDLPYKLIDWFPYDENIGCSWAKLDRLNVHQKYIITCHLCDFCHSGTLIVNTSVTAVFILDDGSTLCWKPCTSRDSSSKRLTLLFFLCSRNSDVSVRVAPNGCEWRSAQT